MKKKNCLTVRRVAAALTALFVVLSLSVPALALEAKEGEVAIQATKITADGDSKTVTLEFDNQSGCTVYLGWGGNCVLTVITSEGTYTLSINVLTFHGATQIMSGSSTQDFTVDPCPGEVEQISLSSLYALEPESQLPDYQLNEAVIYRTDEPDGYIWNVKDTAEEGTSGEPQTSGEGASGEPWAAGGGTSGEPQTSGEGTSGEPWAAVEQTQDSFIQEFEDAEKSVSTIITLSIILTVGFVLLLLGFVVYNVINPNTMLRKALRLSRLKLNHQLEEEAQYHAKPGQGQAAGHGQAAGNTSAQLRRNQEQMERYWQRYSDRMAEVRATPDDISIQEEAQGIARNLLTTMVRGIWLSRAGFPLPEQGEENRLETQINRLAEAGYLTVKSRSNYHQIRKICNAGAHAEWTASKPRELDELIYKEVLMCVTKYNAYLAHLSQGYLERTLSPEELHRMDETALWTFIRQFCEEAGAAGHMSGGPGFFWGNPGEQARQAQRFQEEILETQRQVEQQMQAENQRFQQQQVDQMGRLSVTEIPEGGFVPPPSPPPPPPANPL